MLEFFKKLPLMAQIITIVVLIVFVIIVINYIRKKYEQKKAFNIVENNQSTSANGTSFNIGSAVAGLYNAFYGDWWQEDEAEAMRIIMSTPRDLIPKLKADYFKAYNKNLTDDLLKYLSTYEYSQIKLHYE